MGKVKAHFDTGNYHREADVLRAVVQHFLGCHYVMTAIVAHSRGPSLICAQTETKSSLFLTKRGCQGGNAVILYGAKYRDVPIVVNISGRFNLESGIESRLGKDYLQRFKKDGFIDVKNKKGFDSSWINGYNCSCEDAYEFNKYIPNHKLYIVEGAELALNVVGLHQEKC